MDLTITFQLEVEADETEVAWLITSKWICWFQSKYIYLYFDVQYSMTWRHFFSLFFFFSNDNSAIRRGNTSSLLIPSPLQRLKCTTLKIIEGSTASMMITWLISFVFYLFIYYCTSIPTFFYSHHCSIIRLYLWDTIADKIILKYLLHCQC